jgi:hypothetical protein
MVAVANMLAAERAIATPVSFLAFIQTPFGWF